MHRIVEKKEIARDVFLKKVEAPYIARKRKPGQFLILRIDEHGERIPLTIVDSDPDAGTVTIIYQVVGKTTKELSLLEVGDELIDVVGPLGRPTHIEKVGTVVCVGGGIGNAPLLPIAKGFKEAGNKLITIIGARTKDLLILEDEMREISDEILVTTDDGSYARKGFVTDALKEVIDRGETINEVIAIGPIPMMRAVSEVTRPYGLKTIVSLNPIMVDGTGMCGACRVTIGGKTRFVCVDGPEFDGHEVDFLELAKRNRAYLEQEKLSYEMFLEKMMKKVKEGGR
ncbi:MAG: sulfide/dihydroorotate dehydrogenase-like FAD/NAD-binding protein [Deltaproteobacteria bacterium]|nr:MAG: sulfide/dihydroorotate dehydrogenase-like FAD/NAD-binding protein [Deltaproteobacteria bacterium]